MNTNQIKRFATEARVKLKDGIAAKILQMGFDREGNVAESMMPQLFQGGAVWRGQTVPEGFYRQWMSLYHRIKAKGITEVYEEAAYTWFNRLVAIRILQKNGLVAPVLDFADETLTPRIVNEARMGRLPQMPEAQRQMLVELLDDDTKVTEQFAMLITAWCHQNPIIQSCFGGIADYTELLLPNNILAEGSFVYMLNHTDFITDEDWQTSELIGWLYQFYISERKDEVFAKKGKFEADEIPAATQIFTPNWIVKYMVQNTVGRIYLDNNPYAASLKSRWQYLVENDAQPNSQLSILNCQLEQLKVADLACGSGHILNECFDLLFDLYTFEGYSRREAIESIFVKNLTGIDLDTRAQQLSKFALLLKACQKDEAFADAHVMPQVLTMPQPYDEEKNGDIRGFLHHFFMGNESQQTADDLAAAYDLMKDADSLGSIMKFDLADSSRLALQQMVAYWDSQSIVPAAITEQMPALRLILALTESYHALVMNPPYMGSGNMNATLSAYVKRNYPDSKADLATVFVEMAGQRTVEGGSYAFIIPPSWMFLSTFEGLRRNIIENQKVESLLHLSRGVFGADFGASSAVIRNCNPQNACGTYFRLIERTFQEFEQSHLRILFEQTLANHDFRYCFKDYDKSVTSLPHSEDGKKIFYSDVKQNRFKKIPGYALGYWLSEMFMNLINEVPLTQSNRPRAGLSTADNDRFLRLWFEVQYSKICFRNTKREDLKTFKEKWIPMTKGGTYRRWYGNNEYILNFENDGEELKYWLVNNPKDPTTNSYSRYIRNYDFYCKPGISFSDVACGNPHFRWQNEGMIPNSRGPYIYTNNLCVLGYLNSKIAKTILELLCPTLTFNVGDIGKLPYKDIPYKTVSTLVQRNITISRNDWDAHETSWDFKQNELVAIDETNFLDIIDDYANFHGICIDPAAPQPESLEWRINMYKIKWETKFKQLHENEEELNRQFIEIYGLQDELTPDVPLNEITILQQGEINIWKEGDPIPRQEKNDVVEFSPIIWNDDVLIKQFISYAAGVWMGRYRLDRPGLHIAHPNPTDDEIAPYTYNGEEIGIDDDGIMPLMASDCGFADNAARRMAEFVRQVFGAESQTENLNYMEQCLGKTIEQYFIKDFWKDHKKMYQNRPIYWFFASKKGAFQVLVYMHRMNAYTAERIRSKYLLPYIETLRNRMNDMASRAADLSTQERKRLELTIKQLEECTEYHDRLAVVAEQAIDFDLDDGVVVNHAKFGDVVVKLK